MHFRWGIAVAMEVSEQSHAAVHHSFAFGHDDGLAAARAHPMSLLTVVAFRCDRLILALVVLSNGQSVLIGSVAIGADQPGTPALKADEQAPQGGLVAVSAFPVDQAPPVAVVGLLNPELACFAPHIVPISSISMTLTGSGVGLAQCSST